MDIKKILISIVGISLIVLAIFSNENINAKFVSASTLNNVVDMNVDIDCSEDIGEIKEINISAGSSYSFTFNISNSSSNLLNYGIYYQMVSPDIKPNDVEIGQIRLTATDLLLTSGSVLANSENTITVPIAIKNISNTDIIIQIGILVSEETITYDSSEILINSIINYSLPVDASGVLMPTLPNGMIPVTYNGSKWVKANTTDLSTQNWYDYQNKKWANAVMVKEEAPVSYSCPNGGTLNGTNCEQAATSAYTCAGVGGTLNTSNNRCYTAASSSTRTTYTLSTCTCTYRDPDIGKKVTESCAGGSYPSSSACQNAATSSYCEGTISNITCSPNTTTTYSCSSGWTKSGSQCYKAAVLANTCPTGWTLSGTTCSKAATETVATGYSREYYMNADAGTEILESDILAYYVWIPRYKYKLFNPTFIASSPQEIDIVFETINDPISNGTQKDEYLSHPAFWWDNDSDGVREAGEELSGLWVGKFEISGNVESPTILPNVSPLVNQNVSTLFLTTQKFSLSTYLSSDASVDTHMMKNMDWGAVAYLSHSKYGKNGEVYINNYYGSGKYMTGCGGSSASAGNSSTCNAYNTIIGFNASTTGNITGIYDMSGGMYEYVMAVLQDDTNTNTPMSGTDATYNSGFSGKAYDGATWINITGISFPESKYYDLYPNSGSKYKIGDATGETKSWYNDLDGYVSLSSPWLSRGGFTNETYDAGIFAQKGQKGSSSSTSSYYSCRVSLISN